MGKINKDNLKMLAFFVKKNDKKIFFVVFVY